MIRFTSRPFMAGQDRNGIRTTIPAYNSTISESVKKTCFPQMVQVTVRLHLRRIYERNNQSHSASFESCPDDMSSFDPGL